MTGDEVVTRRECAALHVGLATSLDGIGEKLDKLNGSVAENTKFRVQSKAVYAVIVVAWGLAMAPLTAIAVAVLK